MKLAAAVALPAGVARGEVPGKVGIEGRIPARAVAPAESGRGLGPGGLVEAGGPNPRIAGAALPLGYALIESTHDTVLSRVIK